MNEIRENSSETAYSAEQAKVYDENRFADQAGRKIHETELGQLLYAIKPIQMERSIEVGCGTGRLLIELLELGYSVDGLDASPEMLDKLKEKLRSKNNDITLLHGECGKIPCEANIYDFVYSIRLLNQTESSDYALRSISEMVRISKPGGRILVECINKWRPRVGRNKSLTTRLSPNEMISAGLSAGATPVYIRGAFFLGMGTYERFSGKMLHSVVRFDRVLSRVFPRFCSRTYVLFQK